MHSSDHGGFPGMAFALSAESHQSIIRQFGRIYSRGMSGENRCRELVEREATDPIGRPRKAPLYNRVVQTETFEDLPSAIARNRGDAHL